MLQKHLQQLERDKIVSSWDPGRLQPGETRDDTIARRLDGADIVLLLLSVDLLASSRVYDEQLMRALKRHRRDEARVIPVMLRDADYRYAPFSGLQALPREGQPILHRPMDARDLAWAEVARRISDASRELLDSRTTSIGPSATKAALAASKSTLDDAVSEQLCARVASRFFPCIRKEQRRRFQVGSVFALAVLAVVLLGWPQLRVPTFARRGGIVIAASWTAPAEVRAIQRRLCQELQWIDGPEVQCIHIARLVGKNRVLEAAEHAGAAVVAFVEPAESVIVAPLGPGPLPIDFLPPVHINGEAAYRGLVGILDALRRPDSGDRRPISPLGSLAQASEAGYELALLAVLRDWLRQGGRPMGGDGTSTDRSVLLEKLEEELCQHRGRNHRDPACALARYLDALDCPTDRVAFCAPKLDNLKALASEATDRRLRLMAGIEVVRRTCSSAPEEAGSLMNTLEAEIPADRPCERLLLVPPATCLLVTRPSEASRMPGTQARAEILAEAANCPSALLGSVVAEQGYWWMKGGRWEEARKAFQRAYAFSNDSEQALNLAEVLLLLGRNQDARGSIVLERIQQPALRTHAAFLIWLATEADEDLTELKRAYVSLARGQPGVFDATETIAKLACRETVSQACRIFRDVILDLHIG